jgi:hypothetical protein
MWRFGSGFFNGFNGCGGSAADFLTDLTDVAVRQRVL